jgi:wyosine [tRNA(Phe)-imidazoG37] synthetase (radical SAM superfamily)
LEKLSEKMGYSNKKIVWHPDKLKSFLKKEISAPIYVRVKPTNICNHHCYYCAYDTKNPLVINSGRKDQIPYEKMMELLSDFREMGVKAVTYSGGGEPLTYPHIEEVLEKTIEYGIDLSMITNGQLIKGRVAELLKNAKWIRVSIDACDAKTFGETRRVPEEWFDELVNNLKNFASGKPASCILGVNFVVQEKNFDKVYDAIKLFRNIGVDNIKISPRHIPDGSQKYHEPFKKSVAEQIQKAKEEIKGIDIHDDYENGIRLSMANDRNYQRCYIMQTIPAIGADMNVYFCHDKAWQGIGILGSIKNISFRELWFSNDAKKIFENFNPQAECRHHCTNDTKNTEINDYLGSYGEHVNFV